jgi:hypothetical protein
MFHNQWIRKILDHYRSRKKLMYKCSNMILKFLIRVDKKKQSVKIKKTRKCQKRRTKYFDCVIALHTKKMCFSPHFYTPIKLQKNALNSYNYI